MGSDRTSGRLRSRVGGVGSQVGGMWSTECDVGGVRLIQVGGVGSQMGWSKCTDGWGCVTKYVLYSHRYVDVIVCIYACVRIHKHTLLQAAVLFPLTGGC